MTSVQALNTVFGSSPSYSFLSKPPPPRKGKTPTAPLPEVPSVTASRRRSFSTIVAWASNVQPGSPGSPYSPKSPFNRFSLGLSRNDTSPRRASIAISPSKDTQFFIPLDSLSTSRTPSAADFPLNLTNLGYTSVFVELPKTPMSPVGMKSKVEKPTLASAPSTPSRGKTMRRLRSLSFLPSRSRSGSTTAAPLSPVNDQVTSPVFSPGVESATIFSAALAKRKKATYAHIKPSRNVTPPPPSLAQDLAIMQFVSGGNMEETIKMAMHAQAALNKRAVGDVHRDAKGGIWADREEEMEYVHLLGSKTDKKGDAKWVTFGGEVKDGEDDALALTNLPSPRRGSAVSQDSALDPTCVVKHADEDAMVSLPSQKNLVAPSPSSPMDKSRLCPRPALLNIPSRPNSGIHHHLQGNAAFFQLDLQNFSVPSSPKPPLSPGHQAALAAAQITAPPPSSRAGSPQGRRAAKPAPLTLTDVSKAGRKLPEIELEEEPVTGGVIFFEMVNSKLEFLENSFDPKAPAAADSSLVEEGKKEQGKETQSRRKLRKSISMKFNEFLGRK